ncbi:MAG: phospholipid-binding protein [Cyanobacteria bacterium P01_C01_bin.121]
MGVLGESSVVLIPAVDKPFGAVTRAFSPVIGFRSSPPERIGILGEYDYNGLAKRVAHYFDSVVADDISQLKVRQRGCVVILTGKISSRRLLNRLVDLAIKVEGAALVEIYRMSFSEEEEMVAEGIAA